MRQLTVGAALQLPGDGFQIASGDPADQQAAQCALLADETFQPGHVLGLGGFRSAHVIGFVEIAEHDPPGRVWMRKALLGGES